MKTMARRSAVSGLLLSAAACGSAPAATMRSSGMCTFTTDGGVVYSCNTLADVTSATQAAYCAAPGVFTADQSCSADNAVGTCTIKSGTPGASIVAYFYAPTTCDAAQTTCNGITAPAGGTVTFSGNGC